MPNDGHPPQRPDGTNHGRHVNEKTSPQAMDTTLRTMREVAQLRISGATWREIGSTLGIDHTWAQTLAKRALKEAQYEAADEMRTHIGLRLDRLHRAYWPAALGGDQRAAELCRRITADQRALFGLDAPTRVDVTTGVDPEAVEWADRLGVTLVFDQGD